MAFIRSRAGDDPEGCLWVLDRRLRGGAARSSTRRGPARSTSPRRSGIGASGCANSSRASRPTTPIRSSRSRRSSSAGGCTSRTSSRVAPGRWRGPPRVRSTRGPTRPVAAWRTSSTARSTCRTSPEDGRRVGPGPRARRRSRRPLGRRRVRRLRGAGAASRVLVVAGRRADRRRPASTSARCASGTSRHRSIRTAPPRAVRYPQAGTDNADVSLSVLGLDGSRVDVDWDRDAFPYLVNVTWNDRCPLTLLVLSRDQKRWLVLEVDPDSGKTQTLFEDTAEHWQTVVTGVPDRLSRRPARVRRGVGGHPPDHDRRRARRRRRGSRSRRCSTSATTSCSRRRRIPRSCTCGAARAARSGRPSA